MAGEGIQVPARGGAGVLSEELGLLGETFGLSRRNYDLVIGVLFSWRCLEDLRSWESREGVGIVMEELGICDMRSYTYCDAGN